MAKRWQRGYNYARCTHFNTVVWWRELDEVENECTSHNFNLFVISLPKIIKIGGNLTKFWQKQFCTVFFETRCTFELTVLNTEDDSKCSWIEFKCRSHNVDRLLICTNIMCSNIQKTLHIFITITTLFTNVLSRFWKVADSLCFIYPESAWMCYRRYRSAALLGAGITLLVLLSVNTSSWLPVWANACGLHLAGLETLCVDLVACIRQSSRDVSALWRLVCKEFSAVAVVMCWVGCVLLQLAFGQSDSVQWVTPPSKCITHKTVNDCGPAK